MQLPTQLDNQQLFRPVSNLHTTGTVQQLSQIGILLFGVTNDGTHVFNVVGDVPEYDSAGQLLNARWAIVEGSKREV